MTRLTTILAIVVLALSTTALASDEEAVAKFVSEYDTALNQNDLDAFLALYVEDAVEMPDKEPVLIGIDAIRERDGNFIANYTDKISSNIEDIQIVDDLAVVRTSYQEEWTPKAGGATESVIGKSIIILGKQADGSWKISTVIWNIDHE